MQHKTDNTLPLFPRCCLRAVTQDHSWLCQAEGQRLVTVGSLPVSALVQLAETTRSILRTDLTRDLTRFQLHATRQKKKSTSGSEQKAKTNHQFFWFCCCKTKGNPLSDHWTDGAMLQITDQQQHKQQQKHEQQKHERQRTKAQSKQSILFGFWGSKCYMFRLDH